MEVNLKIPQTSKLNKDVLMLVIPDSKYGEWAPVKLGTMSMIEHWH